MYAPLISSSMLIGIIFVCNDINNDLIRWTNRLLKFLFSEKQIGFSIVTNILNSPYFSKKKFSKSGENKSFLERYIYLWKTNKQAGFEKHTEQHPFRHFIQHILHASTSNKSPKYHTRALFAATFDKFNPHSISHRCRQQTECFNRQIT